MRVHISIPVSDLEKSNAFYSSLFGAPATKVKRDYVNFRLDEPSIHLALVQHQAARPHPLQHFGIELADAKNFAEWKQRAGKVNAATSIEAEPDAKCCYARAEKAWLTDPDGNRWELWHRTGDYEAISEQPVRLDSADCCCSADQGAD